MHYQFDNHMGKAKVFKHDLKESPIHYIVGFFKIYLVGHRTLLALELVNKMHVLLGNKNIMMGTHTQDEATLVGANKIHEKRVNAVDQDLRNNLINHVTKAYGPELCDVST